MDTNFKNNDERNIKISKKKIKSKNPSRKLPPTLSKEPSEIEMQVFVRDIHARESILERQNTFSGPYSAESFDRLNKLNKKSKRKAFAKLKGLFFKSRKSNLGLFAFGGNSSSEKTTSVDLKKIKKQMKMESKIQKKAKQKQSKQRKQDQHQQNQHEYYFKTLLTSTVFAPTVSKTGDETAQKLLKNFLGENSQNKTLEDILNYINKLNEHTSQKSKINPGGESLSEQIDMNDRYLGLKLYVKKGNGARQAKTNQSSVHSDDSFYCNPHHQNHKQYRQALQKLDCKVQRNHTFIPENNIDTSSDVPANFNYFMLDREAYHKRVNSIINSKTRTANNNKQTVDWYLEDHSKKLLFKQDALLKMLNINSSNSPTKWILKSKNARYTKNLNSNFNLSYLNQSRISNKSKSKLTAPNCPCVNQSDEELFRPDESRYQANEFTDVIKESDKCNKNTPEKAKLENSVIHLKCKKNKNLTNRPNTSRPKLITNSVRSSSVTKRDKLFFCSRNPLFNRNTYVTQFKNSQDQKPPKKEKLNGECYENNGHVSLLCTNKPFKQEHEEEMKIESLIKCKEANVDDNSEKKNSIQDEHNSQEYVLISTSVENISIPRPPSITRIRKLSNPRPPILIRNETRRKIKKIMFSESVMGNHESMTSIIRLKSSPTFEDSKTIQSDLDDDYFELNGRKSNISPNNAKLLNFKACDANLKMKLGMATSKGRGQNLRLVKSFDSGTNYQIIGKTSMRIDSIHNYHRRTSPSMETKNLLNNRVINSLLDSFPKPETGTELLESLNRWRDRHSTSNSPYLPTLKTSGEINTGHKSPVDECLFKRHVMYTLCLDNYQLLGKIADATFGRVLFAKITGTNKKCAIKMYEKKIVRGSENNRIFDDNFLAKYIPSCVNRSPFMVHLIDILQTKDHYFFVTEFMDYGNLEMVLIYQGCFQYTQVKFYSAGILLALNYLHDQQLIHRNLKLGNVLVDSKGYPRLSDFGRRACTFKQCNKLASPLGDPLDSMKGIEYIAPEVFSKLDYDYMIDLWAFAVCIVYMLTGKLQRNWKYLIDFLDEIQDKYNSTITSLVKSMTRINPCLRLGSGMMKSLEIFKHPFYEVISWNQYSEKKYIVPVPEKACRTGYTPLNYDLYRVIKNSINKEPNEINGFKQINYSSSPSKPTITSKTSDRKIFQSKSQSPGLCTWRVTPVSSELPAKGHQSYQPQVWHRRCSSPHEWKSGVDCTDKKYKLFGDQDFSINLSVSEKPSPDTVNPRCKIENETTLSKAKDNVSKRLFSMPQINLTPRNEKVQNELEVNLMKELDAVNQLNNPLLCIQTDSIPTTKLDLNFPQNKHQSLPTQVHQMQELQPAYLQPSLQPQNQYHADIQLHTPVPQYLLAATQSNQFFSQNYQQLQNQYQLQHPLYPDYFPQQMQNQFLQMMQSRPLIYEANGYNPYLQLQQQQKPYAQQIQSGSGEAMKYKPFIIQQPRLKSKQIERQQQQQQSQQQQQQSQPRGLTCQFSRDMSKQSSEIHNSRSSKSNAKKRKINLNKSVKGNQTNLSEKFRQKSSLSASSFLSSNSSQQPSEKYSRSLSENSEPKPIHSSTSTEDDLTPNDFTPTKTISQLMNKIKMCKRHSKTIRLSKNEQPMMGLRYEKDLISSKPMVVNKPIIYPPRSNSNKRISEQNNSQTFLL